MTLDTDEIRNAFIAAARLARLDLRADEVEVQLLPAPHQRPSVLPAGRQAVYCFLLGERCLKVGKAGPRTHARFTSQHYGRHAQSTLSKSILKNLSRIKSLLGEAAYAEVEILDIDSVGAWIEKSAARLHLFLPEGAPACALNFAEAFLQCRFRPVYEGKTL